MQVPEAKEKLLSPKLPTDREITILAHFKQGRQQTDKSHAIFKRRETPRQKTLFTQDWSRSDFENLSKIKDWKGFQTSRLRENDKFYSITDLDISNKGDKKQ